MTTNADDAFERVFDFCDRYRWHLDECPYRENNEINPDVLGYIFEMRCSPPSTCPPVAGVDQRVPKKLLLEHDSRRLRRV